MQRINGKSALVSGLAAGVIIVIGQIAHFAALSANWNAEFTRLGIAQPAELAMLTMIVSSLVLGIAAASMYAFAIPRFGAKVETACIAGAVVWLLTCLLPNLTLISMNIFTARAMITGSLVGLVLLPVATCIGTRLYREQNGATVRAMGSRAA